MPREDVFLSIEPKKRFNVLVDVLFNKWCSKAAVIVSVVNQQGGSWRPHGGEDGIVLSIAEVCGVLFNLTGVDWNRDRYPLVQRAQYNSLPAATGQPPCFEGSVQCNYGGPYLNCQVSVTLLSVAIAY